MSTGADAAFRLGAGRCTAAADEEAFASIARAAGAGPTIRGAAAMAFAAALASGFGAGLAGDAAARAEAALALALALAERLVLFVGRSSFTTTWSAAVAFFAAAAVRFSAETLDWLAGEDFDVSLPVALTELALRATAERRAVPGSLSALRPVRAERAPLATCVRLPPDVRAELVVWALLLRGATAELPAFRPELFPVPALALFLTGIRGTPSLPRCGDGATGGARLCAERTSPCRRVATAVVRFLSR